MDWVINPEIWASLLTLTALEIVLGIDNLVFIAILAGRLPAEQQNRTRQVGLALALLTRLALLASITWMIGLTRPLFELFGYPVSWREIVLIAGGLFLLYKGTREIHHVLEGDAPEGEEEHAIRRASFAGVITQIIVLDIVFSLDSVITAVGMANTLWVMATAIIIAVAIMLVASRPLAEFVQRYPTVKMLAAELPYADRHDTDRRRRRVPCPQRVYLRRDRVLGRRRGVEPTGCAPAPTTSRDWPRSRTQAQRRRGPCGQRQAYLLTTAGQIPLPRRHSHYAGKMNHGTIVSSACAENAMSHAKIFLRQPKRNGLNPNRCLHATSPAPPCSNAP